MKKELGDLQKYERVNTCKYLEELQRCILDFADEDGMIQGRTKKFNARVMAENAFLYHNGEIEPNCLTREFGIRQQAMHIRYYSCLHIDS